tara:strand:+ start:176 stop:1348 length:1173 start_codon:yes stop_codon:yes gene_type:complete
MPKITFNAEWDQRSKEIENLKKLELATATVDWMRRPNGLVYLTQAWRTSLQLLRKANIFSGTTDTYRVLKKDGYLVGFDVYMRDESDSFEVPVDGSYWDEDNQKWIEVPEGATTTHCELKQTYIFVLHLCFYTKNEAVDCFTSLSEHEHHILSKGVFEKIEGLDVIKKDPALSSHIVIEHEGNKYDRGWVRKWDYDYEWNEHNNSAGGVLNVIDDAMLLKSVSGASFREISQIISEYRPSAQSSSAIKIDQGRFFKGTAPTSWEEILTGYLLQEGFIVSLEPDIYFPDEGVTGRRVPDLLVFHKGRAIAIEIDDRSHMVYLRDSPDGKHKKGEVNLEKWERDRMLDRMFLSNGIPVLRVWYVEVEKHPERIMSEVIRIYDSLGGERMRLR